MKRLHALLVLTLVAGIGYSQCSGGLFAVPQASATRANMNMENEELLTSTAHIESPARPYRTTFGRARPTVSFGQVVTEAHAMSLASDMWRAVKANTRRQTSPDGCGDGTSCLEQIHRRFAQGIANMDGFGSGVAPDILHVAPPTVAAVIAYETGPPHALTGPLYALAETAAHTIVKRE